MLLFVLLLVACSGGAKGPWQPVAVKDLGAQDVERFESARAAAQTLGAALMSGLLSAMTEDGPTGAIAVCSELAPKLTAEASKKSEGARFGRTSHRLRNPKNVPPKWVADLMAPEPRVYLGPNGELGVTLPITTKEMCLTCHGPVEAMDPELVEKIARLYPEDQAKEFTEGEVRGQFWVELP
jgi:hypothetical protein